MQPLRLVLLAHLTSFLCVAARAEAEEVIDTTSKCHQRGGTWGKDGLAQGCRLYGKRDVLLGGSSG